jgi:hypothetical protein
MSARVVLLEIALGDAGEAGGNTASVQVRRRPHATVLRNANGQSALADTESEAGDHVNL